MVRYIDANKLKYFCRNNYFCERSGEHKCKDCTYYAISEKRVKESPTEDVVPIVYGEWIEEIDKITKEKRYRCSNCNHYESKHTTIKGHYCWNCGAKMEEGEFNE